VRHVGCSCTCKLCTRDPSTRTQYSADQTFRPSAAAERLLCRTCHAWKTIIFCSGSFFFRTPFLEVTQSSFAASTEVSRIWKWSCNPPSNPPILGCFTTWRLAWISSGWNELLINAKQMSKLRRVACISSNWWTFGAHNGTKSWD